MTVYYADSSVLVKRHVNELGSAWVRSLVDVGAGNIIITSRLSAVEVYSALNRRRREASITPRDYADMSSEFMRVILSEYRLVELAAAVADQARLLLERHPLRAADAIQLASCLLSAAALQSAGLPALVFLAADNNLLSAAQAEGLATDNPQPHP